MKYLIPLPIFLALAACGGDGRPATTPEPIVVPTETKVPIAGACVPDTLSAAPDYVDNDAALKAAGGPDDRLQLLWAGREQRKGRLNELEPIVAGCPHGHVTK